MKITIKKKEYDLKFTFNSFKYMEDFDLQEIALLERKPFKMIPITEQLLIGALNNDPKKVVLESDVSEYLETVMEEGNITELLEELMDLLQNSSFFKNLQESKPKKK